MQLGMIGLGKMGANMTVRLLRGGHEVVAYDTAPEAVRQARAQGARGADSLEQAVDMLSAPRALWLMVPAGEPTEDTVDALAQRLAAGDVVVDGGNSYYRDSQRRAAALRERGVYLVDVGTSGGIWGLAEGYCLMIGGDPEAVERLRPAFETLAPAPDQGWGRVGPVGAGHFAKMVHNGIEYGVMEAYAEGFELLARKQEFGLDLRQVAQMWTRGSVVRSWLLELTARALADDPDLSEVAPHVEDSGEGRWTAMEAIEMGVALPAITSALQRRFRSRDERSFAERLLAALRAQFGGHAVKRPE